jgi:hypothetical protein
MAEPRKGRHQSIPVRPTGWIPLFTRWMPESWRWAHRAYARLYGYFWKPCPLCGREFGGHEWRDIGGQLAEVPGPFYPAINRSVGICPPCTRAGRGAPTKLRARHVAAVEWRCRRG